MDWRSARRVSWRILGSFFGVGGTVSDVPSTKTLYAGPTVVFCLRVADNGSQWQLMSVPPSQNRTRLQTPETSL